MYTAVHQNLVNDQGATISLNNNLYYENGCSLPLIQFEKEP